MGCVPIYKKIHQALDKKKSYGIFITVIAITINAKHIAITIISMKKKYISPQEVVDRYHISYSSLNYYTNIGLFKVKKRNGNVRLYGEEEFKERKAKITRLINEGYPLRIICKLVRQGKEKI